MAVNHIDRLLRGKWDRGEEPTCERTEVGPDGQPFSSDQGLSRERVRLTHHFLYSVVSLFS